MRIKLLFLLPLIFSLPNYSQNVSHSIINSYIEYFKLPRESIFLHLNKSIFLKGEDIWFTGYIYNRRTGFPFLETTNLYCGIYDSKGKQLTKKLFYAENGIVKGKLQLNSGFGSGEFFIKGYTTWMKNFVEDDSFVQKVYVLDKYVAKVSKDQGQYSITSSPEGGVLITDIINTIGFKIESTLPGRIKIKKGIVRDDKNVIVVKNITSNKNGIGKFLITPKQNRTYFFEIEFDNGQTIRNPLPKVKKTGITISVNNFIEEKVYVSLQTNQITFKDIKNKAFYLATHRDGRIKVQRFIFDKPKKTLVMPKKDLIAGINILTLFDEKSKPLLERLIFNEYGFASKKLKANIEIINKTKDSATADISLPTKNTKLGSLSISIIPEDSNANQNNHSIFSHFLLQSYVKSKVNHLSEFSRQTNRYTFYELDVMLLTSGWSKYNWKNIFDMPPIRKNSFERGIDIKGKILNASKHKNNHVVLYQPGLGNFSTTDIQSEGEFGFKNQYILKGETLNIGVSNGKSFKKVPDITLSFFPETEKDSIQITTKSNKIFTYKNTSQNDDNSFELRNNENIIDLDSVLIKQKKRKPKLTRNPKLTAGIFEGKKINQTDVKKYVRLSNLIRKLGFRTRSDAVSGKFFILPKTYADQPPIVILDDIRMMDNTFDDLLLSSVDEIYYESFGMQGSNGGTIYIYRKYGENIIESQKRMITKIAAEGYERQTNYFNPILDSSIDKTFLNFGQIHWVSDITLNKNNKACFSFPHYNLDEVKVFINGMTSDGKLISTMKTLNFN